MIENTVTLPRISDYPAHHASKAPMSLAVAGDGERLTYGEFAARIDACARALLGAGITHGDRVATLSTPSADHLVLFMATARIGAIWLGLNPKATYDELAYQVADAEPRLLFTISEFEGRDHLSDCQRLCREHACLEAVFTIGGGEQFDTNIDPEARQTALDNVKPEDPALIVYTSGSTGQPKGALLTHRGMVTTGRIQCHHWWAAPFRILNNIPINHVGGAVQLAGQAIVAGGANVLMSRFRPEEIPAFIAREGVTVIHQVSAMYQMIIDRGEPERHDLSSLQALIWSGSACSGDQVAQLRTWCANLFTSYGQTEVGGEVLFTVPGESDEVLTSTVGYPTEGIEVRLADGGELQVRGPTVMAGYWRRPEATSETFTSDGWLRTGDILTESPDGVFRIAGRLKEMFKSGGYNVYPREIEIVLEGHPGVAIAAVVAVDDSVYAEVGHAYVQPETGATLDMAGLEALCREKLANYKIPKRFILRHTLPTLPVGKVDKAKLRDEANSSRT